MRALVLALALASPLRASDGSPAPSDDRTESPQQGAPAVDPEAGRRRTDRAVEAFQNTTLEPADRSLIEKNLAAVPAQKAEQVQTTLSGAARRGDKLTPDLVQAVTMGLSPSVQSSPDQKGNNALGNIVTGGGSTTRVPAAASAVVDKTAGSIIGSLNPGLGGKIAAGIDAPNGAASQLPESRLEPKSWIGLTADNPGNPYFAYGAGVSEMTRGDHRAAYGHFETAINGGRNDPQTMTFAALSAYQAGRPRQAYDWSSQALADDPDGPLAESARAIKMLSRKRLPAEDEPKGPARRPEEEAPRRARPRADSPESIPELERAAAPRQADPALPPETAALLADVNRLVAQAQRAYRTGETKEALSLAKAALAKDPEDVRAIQVEAAALMKEGRWNEAKEAAERGLDLAPGYVPLMLVKTAASVHLRDWRSAADSAGAILRKEPDNGTARRFLAFAQAGLGDRAGALASLSRAALNDPVAAALLKAARALPPGSDLVDLFMGDMPPESTVAPQPLPEAPRRGVSKWLIVAAASLGAGLFAGLVIVVLGRAARDDAPSDEAPRPRWPGRS